MDKALTDMLLSLLGYVSENERAYIRERQSVGIEIVKKEGHSKNSIWLKYNVGYGTIQRISEEINRNKLNESKSNWFKTIICGWYRVISLVIKRNSLKKKSVS